MLKAATEAPGAVERQAPSGNEAQAVLHLCVPGGEGGPPLLALGSPIFPSGCEGKLGVALESLQGPYHDSRAMTSSP